MQNNGLIKPQGFSNQPPQPVQHDQVLIVSTQNAVDETHNGPTILQQVVMKPEEQLEQLQHSAVYYEPKEQESHLPSGGIEGGLLSPEAEEVVNMESRCALCSCPLNSPVFEHYHSEVMDFECFLCLEKFSTRCDLFAHEIKNFTGSIEAMEMEHFSCVLCGSSFITECLLITHRIHSCFKPKSGNAEEADLENVGSVASGLSSSKLNENCYNQQSFQSEHSSLQNLEVIKRKLAEQARSKISTLPLSSVKEESKELACDGPLPEQSESPTDSQESIAEKDGQHFAEDEVAELSQRNNTQTADDGTTCLIEHTNSTAVETVDPEITDGEYPEVNTTAQVAEMEPVERIGSEENIGGDGIEVDMEASEDDVKPQLDMEDENGRQLFVLTKRKQQLKNLGTVGIKRGRGRPPIRLELINIGKYQCKKCLRRFPALSLLEEHDAIHVWEKKCVICDESFESKEELKEHYYTHASEVMYKCMKCARVFDSLNKLRGHEKRHEGDLYKNFGCQYCGKKFFNNFMLERHVRVHTHERPFQCKVCGQRFTQSSSLKGHMRLHEREIVKDKIVLISQ